MRWSLRRTSGIGEVESYEGNTLVSLHDTGVLLPYLAGQSLQPVLFQMSHLCTQTCKKHKVLVVSIRGNTVPCSPHGEAAPRAARDLSCCQVSKPEKQNTQGGNRC